MPLKKQISLYFIYYIFIILIIVLAGNKCDLYHEEEVDENDAKKYAKEIGAFYKLTSALSNIGIDDIFHYIGCKYLDPNYKVIEEDEKDENDENDNNKNNNIDNKNDNNFKSYKNNNKRDSVKLDSKKVQKKKKCCN